MCSRLAKGGYAWQRARADRKRRARAGRQGSSGVLHRLRNPNPQPRRRRSAAAARRREQQVQKRARGARQLRDVRRPGRRHRQQEAPSVESRKWHPMWLRSHQESPWWRRESSGNYLAAAPIRQAQPRGAGAVLARATPARELLAVSLLRKIPGPRPSPFSYRTTLPPICKKQGAPKGPLPFTKYSTSYCPGQ